MALLTVISFQFPNMVKVTKMISVVPANLSTCLLLCSHHACLEWRATPATFLVTPLGIFRKGKTCSLQHTTTMPFKLPPAERRFILMATTKSYTTQLGSRRAPSPSYRSYHGYIDLRMPPRTFCLYGNCG